MTKMFQTIALSLTLMTGAVINAQQQAPTSNYDFAKYGNGKTAKEFKFLTHPLIKEKIVRMVGAADYQYLLKNWQTETPMSVVGPTISAEGCKKGNCKNTNFILLLNYETGQLNLGMRKNGGKSLIFSDPDTSDIPGLIDDWAEGNR